VVDKVVANYQKPAASKKEVRRHYGEGVIMAIRGAV
jgi:hypothetical protein